MAGTFLVRFDDLCPTMNWDTWNSIEKVLDRNNVRPLVAVVPDNRDPKLVVDQPRADFWERVRNWQEKGWTVGLHGYRHVYETKEAGLVGLNDRSEFAGLSSERQARKLRAGLAIFARQQVRTKLWIAPGHSFDRTTLHCLAKHGLKTISDGFYLYPGRDAGDFFWIPQQLWGFRSMPFGVWTVCCHANTWTKANIEGFERDLLRFRRRIVDMDWVWQRFGQRRLRVYDRLFSFFWGRWLRFRQRTANPAKVSRER